MPNYRFSSCAFLGFFIYCGFIGAESLNCTKSSSCLCEGEGFEINIEDAFTYPYNITNNPEQDNPQKYTYDFSPCKALESCGTIALPKTVVMCQNDIISPTDRDASLGIITDVEWSVANKNNFTIVYKGGDAVDANKVRWTEIHVQVDHNGRDTIEFVEEDQSPSDHITYKFLMSIKSDEPNISTGKPVGYIGIVIILIAILSLVLYFIIGTAFLYYVRGARGLEAFPNYTFWRMLPVYIKDGFCFTISPCRNKIKKNQKYQPL